MQVTYEKTGPCFGKLSVTIPASEVDEAFTKAYRSLAKQVRIPGFRPGKAPRQVIEARYRDELRQDVEEALIRGSLPKAIDQEKVSPVASPQVEPGDLKKGADFSYTAQLETQPEIELKQYEGLEVVKAEVESQDEAVEQELQRLREQSVQLVPILDRDVVQEGDLVMADYEATQGGVPLPGSKAENSILEVGPNEFIPGISKGLIGATVPSQRDVPVDFPDDFALESWRGKQVTFKVDLKELKKKELPELDDEFAKDLGEDTLESLRAKIREGLEKRAEAEAKSEQRRHVLEALIKANPFEVPPSMINEQVDRMIVDAAMRVRQMMGPNFDFNQLDLEGLRSENRDLAEFNVRSGLLLLEVSEKAKVEVTDEDIDAEIESMTAEAGDEKTRLVAQLNKPDERQRLKYKLLEDKTIELLLSSAKMVDAPPPAEETPAEKAPTEDTTANDSKEE